MEGRAHVNPDDDFPAGLVFASAALRQMLQDLRDGRPGAEEKLIRMVKELHTQKVLRERDTLISEIAPPLLARGLTPALAARLIFLGLDQLVEQTRGELFEDVREREEFLERVTRLLPWWELKPIGIEMMEKVIRAHEKCI